MNRSPENAQLLAGSRGGRDLTLGRFLARTAGLSQTAVRAAMVQAIADVSVVVGGRRQPLGRAAYARFYTAALQQLASGPPREPHSARVIASGPPPASGIGGPAACRRLAARVIDQALRDLLNPGEDGANRDTARAFLAGSPWLHYWCEVAGLEPLRVIKGVARILAANDRAHSGTWRKYLSQTAS
jgi:hypothetical protein